MLEKIESGFDVKLKPGESLMTCDKKNEYVDMLDDFTNRENHTDGTPLAQRGQNAPSSSYIYCSSTGKKDNPWEKLDYNAVKNIKKDFV